MKRDAEVFSNALDIVRRAGALFSDRQRAARVRSKGKTDFVTDVDTQVQTQIRLELAALDAQIQFLGEEQASAPDWKKPVWVLDPVDGTTNLIHGFGHCAVSLALAEEGRPVFGAVYDPFADELFWAARGQGAFCNGQRMEVSKTARLADGLCSAGTNPGQRDSAEDAFRRMRILYDRCHDVRRLGAASLELCYVACGRLDGYEEHGLRPWDMAAGWIIVEQAGGIVTDFHGHAPKLADNRLDVVASNGRLQQELLSVL